MNIFESILVNILMCTFAVIYPWVHGFLIATGEDIFKENIKLLSYFKMINIFYMLIFIFVISLFALTDFSLLSGWEFFKEGGLDAKNTVWVPVFIIFPTVILLSTIIYGKESYTRIMNPKSILIEEND